MIELKERIKIFIKSYEKLRDSILYPVKSPQDKIICPICGFNYIRRFKSKHDASILHIEANIKMYNNEGTFYFQGIMTDIK